MSTSYDDILHLPRPVSPTRPPMSMENRAAQFAPFAALRGYDGAIAETARHTQERVILDQDAIAVLDAKLQRLHALLPERPAISVTYFRPDERKGGGAYLSVTGIVKGIDLHRHVLRLEGGGEIAIANILEIASDCFPAL